VHLAASIGTWLVAGLLDSCFTIAVSGLASDVLRLAMLAQEVIG